MLIRTHAHRAVTCDRHPPYGHRTGVFAAAYEACRKRALGDADHAELRVLLDWFEANLAIPDRLTASRYPRAKETAISWVRASAEVHTRKLRRVAAIVSATGIAVEELRTARPGYVVYQDDHQVVALPFSDTPR